MAGAASAAPVAAADDAGSVAALADAAAGATDAMGALPCWQPAAAGPSRSTAQHTRPTRQHRPVMKPWRALSGPERQALGAAFSGARNVEFVEPVHQRASRDAE